MPRQESTEFDAVAHIKQFEDIFHIYGVDVHKQVLNQLSDNTCVNK